MRFAWELEIAQPLDRVMERLADPQHPLRWQPGLVRIVPLEGTLGREGSVARYEFDLHGRYFELVETVLVDRLPEERVARYEGRGLVHTVTNRFTAVDAEVTGLLSRHEGFFTGAARLLALPLRRPMRERWRIELAHFRTYIESGTPRGLP